MHPDDLPRLRARHADRADRQRLEDAYRTENRIFLACLAGALFVMAAQTGALRRCVEALALWWGAR